MAYFPACASARNNHPRALVGSHTESCPRAEQDVELTAEQMEDAAERLGHAAAVAVNQLRGLKSRKPIDKKTKKKSKEERKKSATKPAKAKSNKSR